MERGGTRPHLSPPCRGGPPLRRPGACRGNIRFVDDCQFRWHAARHLNRCVVRLPPPPPSSSVSLSPPLCRHPYPPWMTSSCCCCYGRTGAVFSLDSSRLALISIPSDVLWRALRWLMILSENVPLCTVIIYLLLSFVLWFHWIHFPAPLPRLIRTYFIFVDAGEFSLPSLNEPLNTTSFTH
jgi:hypothetical protein